MNKKIAATGIVAAVAVGLISLAIIKRRR